jgi:cytochrome c6
MVFGLSTGHELGLAVTGGLFILFAVISSFVLPARYPNFPGKGRNWYLLVCVLFFIAMMAAVINFGKEEKVPGVVTAAAAAGNNPPAATTSGGTTQVLGDPTAGEAIFKSKGCTACHTLKAAGSTGTVGPNLDDAKPPYSLIIDRVTNGAGAMPPFKGQLSAAQIHDVAAYVYTSTH